MRSKAHRVIVLLRADPERGGAKFRQNFHEGADARVTITDHRTDESITGVAKEIGIGVGQAGRFAAGHRMPAEEQRPGLFGKIFGGDLRDAQLGAARIGDQRMRRRVTGDLRKQIERGADGQRNKNEVGAAQRLFQRFGINSHPLRHVLRFGDYFVAVPAGMRMSGV